jgi:hypothetical protein
MILKVSKIGETPILSFDFPYQIRAALTPYRATDVCANLPAAKKSCAMGPMGP